MVSRASLRSEPTSVSLQSSFVAGNRGDRDGTPVKFRELGLMAEPVRDARQLEKNDPAVSDFRKPFCGGAGGLHSAFRIV